VAELTLEGLGSDIRIYVAKHMTALNCENQLRDVMMMEGFERALNTMEALHNETGEQLAGFDGRLRDHNARIARLERHNNLR